MRKLVLGLVLILVSTGIARAEPPTVERLYKLFEVTGVDRMGDTVLAQIRPIILTRMGAAIRQQAQARNLEVPPEFDRILMEEFDSAFGDLDSVILLELVPVYQEVFDAADVEALIEFYDTDLGRRLVSIGEQIAPVAMRVGGQFGVRQGQEMASNVLGRLKKADEQVN